ncbi:transcription antitermination factor NusB [Ferribacterium limneticum]|uniref:transcription antitermination factor NusB n=1 Tax=Ferribacterium limneticum TaxID=76259 RepID=UPI001CFABAF8|nr:transcription antitermination factor NusB [Ferribacterium limneticum]UCV28068.1 transcription antitermination factor NusB [Ferribacterium limneticum]UCV31985.1 transcription antitermination factor NusB [Ferribacterium limneticum]
MTTFLSDSEHPQDVKAPPKSARRRAREFVLQGLYQWRVGGADEAAIEAYAPEMEGFAKADREFFVGTLRGVMAQQEKLIEQVSVHIDRPFTELSPVEACILMLGSFEMLNHAETPYRVIINEAIELTKSFGGTDGHKYVNGVLDKVAAILRPDEVAARKKSK